MNYLQHISQVLSNLSAEGREGSAAYRKLEQFDVQFAAYGEGHWMLAAHAAFPMLLTPDLLYRIWHNFQTFQDAAGQDQLIDRVAVSDLLLSPLLREIGTEVFEMPGKIRSALLSCLEKRFEQSDPQRLYDLSQFLMQYYQYMPSGKNYIWDQMRDLQEWHAMAYMQPETAADQLREAMSDAVRSNQKGQQYRLQMLVEKLDQQFETLGKAERQDKSFQTLVAYTKGMQAFQEGEYQEAIESFADLPTVPAESEAGEGQDLFTITVPKAVQQELKKRDTEQPKGTLRANFVAINQYENISPLSAAVSDAERLKSWLQERVENRPLEVQSLHDEAATEDAITGMLINTLEQAQSEDTVLFYFAGTGVELSQNGLQGPRSVFAGVDFQLVRDQPVGGISDQDMRNILQEYNRNNAFVCILFDACNVGTASWIDIDNPRQIMLSASRLQEKAYEIRTGGAFTTALLDILNAQEVIPNMNSLSMAIRDEVQRQFEEQTPQLFGHYQTRLRTFLNLGESREEDLLTRAFQEMDLWKESLSTSIQALVERSELIDRAALLPWMSTFSTLKSTDQLEVLNLTGMDFVRLFRNIISELTSPVIRYQTENLEELDLPGYGNIVPPTNIQQQSNLGSYSLDSEPEKRDYYSLILQPDVVMLPLNEWMVQQLSQNAELHDALMERWMRDRPVIPILMEACAWESTIAVRFAGQLLQTSPPEGSEAQRAQYEQSLKTYLGLWWQAQLMDLRKQIEDGRLSRVFMSLKNKLPSDSALQETLVSLEEVIEKVDAPGTKGSTTEGNPPDIQAIYDELNAFLEQITVDDFFEVAINYKADSNSIESDQLENEPETEEKKIDILIITPIELEFLSIRQYLENVEEVSVDGIYYLKGTYQTRYENLTILLKRSGSKNNDVALVTQKGIWDWQPSFVFLLGIAGGVKDVQIGDVVIATKAYGYESGKYIDQEFVARPEVWAFDKELLAYLESFIRSDVWSDRVKQMGASQPKVFMGPIAAGDKVIASTQSEEYKIIKKHYNDTLALEMEAVGFAKATSSSPSCRAANIRGVSDLLDDKEGADRVGSQEQAMSNLSVFFFEALKYMKRDKENISFEFGIETVILSEADKPFHLALEESIDPEEQEALRGLFSESDTIFDLNVPLASAEYSLSVEDGMYLLKEEGEVVVVTNREDRYLLLEKINHFFRWKYMLTVENLGAINAGDYEIEFFVSRTEEDASQNQFDPIDWQDGLDFEAEPAEEGYYNIWLRAKVTNRSRRALHCTALYLSQEYIINPQMLNNQELGPREEAWLIEGRNIRVNPEVEYKQGRPTLYHNTDFIKFFFSREPMPLDGFRQESIHQLPEASKVLPSNDMSLPRVDWTSEVVGIRMRLPEERGSSLETFKQELKEQIVRAKEWEVIEALLNRTPNTASSRDQVLIFANWYQFVQQNLNNGTITNDSAAREFTRLRSDLLSYIDTLNDEDILEENVLFFELAGAKNQLKQQIAKGKIRQVLLELEDQIDEGGEEGVLMLMAEYNGLKREIDRGTIDFISIRTTRERILKQLLVLLKSNFYPKEPVNPEFEDRTELTAFQKEVRQLLAEGHIDRPVEMILQRINPAADIYDDFIGLLHWYRFVERQFSLGMVSQQDAMVDQNNIRQAILQLITDISPADLEGYGKVDKYLEEVRRILSEGKLKEALDFLSSIPQLKKEVVILQQNFSKLNRETVIGTLGYAEIRTRRNRIVRNALELVSGFFDVR